MSDTKVYVVVVNKRESDLHLGNGDTLDRVFRTAYDAISYCSDKNNKSTTHIWSVFEEELE